MDVHLNQFMFLCIYIMSAHVCIYGLYAVIYTFSNVCVRIHVYKHILYYTYFLCWFLVIRLLKPFSSFQPHQLDMCKHGTKYFKISVFGKNKINKNNKKSGCQVGRLRTIFQDFPFLYNKRFLFRMYNNDSPSAIYFEFLPPCSSIEFETIQLYGRSGSTL